MADIKFTFTGDTTNLDEALNKEIAHIKNLGKNTNATTAEINKAFAKLGADLVKSAGVDKALESIKGQMEAQKKAIDDLMPRWKELDELMTKAANGEGKVSFEQTEEYKKLNTEIENLNKSYAEYETVLKGAQAESAKVSKSVDAMKSLGEAASAVPGPVGNAVGGLKRLITAAKAFIATPLGMVLGALAAAFGILKSYLSGTAEGQRKLAKASAIVSSVFESIKDLAQALGEKIVKAFSDPKKAISEMVDTLKTRLQNRLEGFVDQWKALGKIIKSVFHLDWDGVNEGAKEFGEAFVKMGTGRTIEDFKKMGEEMADFANKTRNAADQAAALANRELNLREQRSKWQIKEAKLEEQIAEARLKAYDEDATKAEQAKALANAQELIRKKYEQQIAFAKEEYNITKEKNALHDNTIEDYEKEDELLATITQLQAQLNSELAGFERRRASLSKASEAELLSRLQEEKNLELEIGQKRLEMQDESLEKTLELIKLDKQRKQLELQAQEQNWKQNQQGQLTQAQKDYIKSMSGLIEEAAVAAGEQAIFEKYADAAQKAFKQNQIADSEIQMLKDKGREREAAEAERQRNEQALAYMQDVEGGLTPEFKMWIDSLGDYTTKTLESMLASAEEQLTVLKAAGAPQEQIIAAEARIAALNKEVKEAQTDIQRGPKLTAYKNLNKILGDAASGFEALGQTGNEAFDSLMKNVADITNSVQSVVGNIQTLVQSSIEAEKTAAQEGASAVKTVEKASVILAIIGAALALAMKIKSMFADDGSRTEEVTKQVDALRNALRDLKREMALDVSQNDTIFGDNQFKNLQQYTKATQDYAAEYQKAVNEMALAGMEAERRRQRGNVKDGLFGVGGDKERDSIDKMFAELESHYKDRSYTLSEAVQKMMDETMIQTQKKGWLGLRKEKFSSLQEIAKNNGLEIIGKDDEETIKNLKVLKDSISELDDEQKTTIDNMIADWETYNDAIEGTKGVLADFFNDMTNSFAESIKTGFTDGAKAGRQNFKEQVNGMVSDFYLQMRIGERTAQMEKDYTEKMLDATGDTKEQQNIALAYANELSKMYDEELAAYESLQTDLENRGYGLKDALDGTLSGAIKGASQESIDLLSGYCNAVRIQQVDGINIMREQLISLSGIEGNTRAINVGLQGFRTSMENILRTDGARAVGAN